MKSAVGMAIRSKESCVVSGHATGVYCGGVAVRSLLSLMYVSQPLFTFSFCCFLLLLAILWVQNRCLRSTVTGHAECWLAVGISNISDFMHDEGVKFWRMNVLQIYVHNIYYLLPRMVLHQYLLVSLGSYSEVSNFQPLPYWALICISTCCPDVCKSCWRDDYVWNLLQNVQFVSTGKILNICLNQKVKFQSFLKC